jgi:hypothetical protein
LVATFYVVNFLVGTFYIIDNHFGSRHFLKPPTWMVTRQWSFWR